MVPNTLFWGVQVPLDTEFISLEFFSFGLFWYFFLINFKFAEQTASHASQADMVILAINPDHNKLINMFLILCQFPILSPFLTKPAHTMSW